MKKLLLLLFVGGTLNASAQAVKDTVFIGDSVAYPKLYDSVKNYYFCNYKGKKIRTAKKDKGKRAFIIYNTNTAGERNISKIYYAN
jgi:hypothetical protein